MNRYLTLIVFLLAGCASITYQSPSGEKMTYTRWGAQNISGLSVTKNADGVTTLNLESNKADMGQLADVLKSMAEIAAKAAAAKTTP